MANDAFLYGPSHLMKSWKKLRASLTDNLSDYNHLELVNNFWSLAPISSPCLNWDSPNEWVDPWALINDMDFDESSVSLGMKYSLELSNDGRWNLNRLKLKLIKDDYLKIQRLVLIVDNKWLLNYEYKKIIELDKILLTFMVQQTYSYNGKKYSIE